jgi:hypothetical protein
MLVAAEGAGKWLRGRRQRGMPGGSETQAAPDESEARNREARNQ